MTGADLRELATLLTRALAAGDRVGAFAPGLLDGTVAGRPPATREDWAAARDLVASLAGEDPEELALDPDLPQLAFHLREELAAGAADAVGLARSLTFLGRHLVALRRTYVERVRPDDHELVLALARLARQRYDARFAAAYEQVGYRRPFVDKFLRDHRHAGIPGGLLRELDRVAGRYDAYVCVLKGGLTYALILELFGVPPERIVHVMCGRADGSHVDPAYTFRALDFEVGELRGRRVLVVENNVATGRTLALLARSLPPADLFLDHVIEDVAGLTPATLPGFERVICGPYPDVPADALKRRLLSAARSAPPTAPARTPSAAGARR